jgi:hypothetical protein
MLAQNAIVVCGKKHIPWPLFARGALLIDVLERLGYERHRIADWNRDKRRNNVLASGRPWSATAMAWDHAHNATTNATFCHNNGNRHIEYSYLSAESTAFERYYKFLHYFTQYHWVPHFLYVCCMTLVIATCVIVFVGGVFNLRIQTEKIREASPRWLRVYWKIISPDILYVIFWIMPLSGTVGFVLSSLQGRMLRQVVELKGEIFASNRVSDIVDVICTRVASEPEDKLFGILSVMQRQSATELLVPSVEAPLGDVYHALSTNILLTAGSLRLLLPASLHPMFEQPSWVARWSRPIPEPWKRLDCYQTAEQTSWKFLDESHQDLVIRGHNLFTVSEKLSFYDTDETYGESFDELDQHNLIMLMRMFSISTYFGFPGWLEDSIWEACDFFSVWGDDWKQLREKLCTDNQTAVELWSHLVENESKWTSSAKEILRFQRHISQYFCYYQLAVYIVNPTEDPGEDDINSQHGQNSSSGILVVACDEVKVGDHVIEFIGLSGKFVVRPNGACSTLISPVDICRHADWKDYADKGEPEDFCFS